MLKTQQEVMYSFPVAQSEKTMEWKGTSIGKSNLITRTKSRTKINDKTIDERPSFRESLMDSVARFLAANKEQTYIYDVIIHGLRVRAITNSQHLMDFWKENWYSPEEWQKVTGQTPSTEISIRVYALGGVEEQPEAAYYSRVTNTIMFFNTSYYGQLKSWVLGAVGRVLASEYGIHSIHGACVEKDKQGILYIAPTGTGKSTSSYGLMDYPNSRFHSDDWVYIRYCYHTKDGRLVSPLSITLEKNELITTDPKDADLRGFQCFKWISDHPASKAEFKGWGIHNEQYALTISDLDLTKPIEAYAYLSEKVFYLRCNLAENFPESLVQLLKSNLENVPDATCTYIENNFESLESNYKTLIENSSQKVRDTFKGYTKEQVIDILSRFSAFDNARAMLDISCVFDKGRIFANPMEPVKLTTVMLLKRNTKEDLILEGLPLDLFMERLLFGETPMNTREIAYNAYRAVDDAKESSFVKKIEALAKERGMKLYDVYKERQDIPQTLYEEFELFKVMHNATSCYSMNTILTKDPGNNSLRDAVAATMKVIAKCIASPSKDVKLTLANYKDFIK